MTTTPRKKRETWVDWIAEGVVIPEANLITREELISALANHGAKATQKDFANWQAAGFIPYGVLRWHEATHKTRALYPDFMVALILQLRKHQAEGMHLQEIAPNLRRSAYSLSRTFDNPWDLDEDKLQARLTNLADKILKAILTEIAEAHSEESGRQVARVDVRFFPLDPDGGQHANSLELDLTDTTGARFTYHWP